MAEDNRLLGQFNLEGIPPAPRGIPQVEVTFDIDQNGILNVRAKDVGSGKEASVRIEDSAGLTEKEISRMQKDAEQHSSEDKQRRELAEMRNTIEHHCFQLEKLIRDNSSHLTNADREPLERAMHKARDAAKGNDTSAVKSALQELEQASEAVSKALYERSQASASSGQNSETGPEPSSSYETAHDDDIVDAEFEVKT